MAKAERPRKFFLHFNKPATQQRGRVTISLHHKDRCHLLDNVICNVPTRGRTRASSPRFVIEGFAKSVVIADGVATID